MKMRRCCDSDYVEVFREIYERESTRELFWYVACPLCDEATGYHIDRQDALMAWNHGSVIPDAQRLPVENDYPEGLI